MGKVLDSIKEAVKTIERLKDDKGNYMLSMDKPPKSVLTIDHTIPQEDEATWWSKDKVLWTLKNYLGKIGFRIKNFYPHRLEVYFDNVSAAMCDFEETVTLEYYNFSLIAIQQHEYLGDFLFMVGGGDTSGGYLGVHITLKEFLALLFSKTTTVDFFTNHPAVYFFKHDDDTAIPMFPKKGCDIDVKNLLVENVTLEDHLGKIETVTELKGLLTTFDLRGAV